MSTTTTRTETTSTNPDNGIPRLPYTLHTPGRIRAISIFFILLIIEAGALPIILFYSLKLGAHLSMTKNLAIITSLVGTFSGYRFSLRAWYLWFDKKSFERRPIGSGRWGMDASQVLISFALTGFFVPLVIGSSLTPASPATVSMALPCFMLAYCVPLAITGLFFHRIRLPFRVSSLPPHEPLPPGIFTLVEDIIAVDGGGNLAFREAWRQRYESSAIMRQLLRDLSIAWGLAGTLVATALIVISWTTPDNVGVGIGYGVPWIWGIVGAMLTVIKVRRELEREEREWSRSYVHDEISLHIKGSRPSTEQEGSEKPARRSEQKV